LYLVESTLAGAARNKEGFEGKLGELRGQLASREIQVVEVQVSRDFSRVFLILEGGSRTAVNEGLRELGVSVTLIKPVRLIGSELDQVKRQSEAVNYLVEWNLPEGLTMDQYLERKRTNSVHYAEVPDVAFSRTYVCEDMTKCLCFYEAPDEQAVKRARQAVKAPIDSITEILPQSN